MSYGINTDQLVAFREGREEGFNHFFNQWYKPLYFFAGRYITDKAAAEDIITDSFIRLWHKREIFETESGLKSYLYRSVYNACIRWLQQKQTASNVIKSYTSLVPVAEPSFMHNIIKSETLQHLHKAIQALPPQCRTVFTKLYIEEKSVAETATEMNLTISTIKNQKARGMKLLKLKLTP